MGSLSVSIWRGAQRTRRLPSVTDGQEGETDRLQSQERVPFVRGL